mmetsp:Transcript_2053/g.7391  ORF Transcript_2053/g.7391 Transcript_2053/m.7391 type:complete len:183 (-) Transcript_2053:105-653(-)
MAHLSLLSVALLCLLILSISFHSIDCRKRFAHPKQLRNCLDRCWDENWKCKDDRCTNCYRGTHVCRNCNPEECLLNGQQCVEDCFQSYVYQDALKLQVSSYECNSASRTSFDKCAKISCPEGVGCRSTGQWSVSCCKADVCKQKKGVWDRKCMTDDDDDDDETIADDDADGFLKALTQHWRL